ncbi:MAG: hypothetical protein ACI8S6_002476 [Myxococcota bacterium]|jgi:hypothetical protein
MNKLSLLLMVLITACDPKETDSGIDGACPVTEQPGTCTWTATDDDGGPVITFEGDDGTTATFGGEGEDLDFLDDSTCVEESGIEEGGAVDCSLDYISGGCEPGYFFTCE